MDDADSNGSGDDDEHATIEQKDDKAMSREDISGAFDDDEPEQAVEAARLSKKKYRWRADAESDSQGRKTKQVRKLESNIV